MTSQNYVRFQRFSARLVSVLSLFLVACAVMALAGPAVAQTTEDLFFDPDRPGFESPGGSGTTAGGGGSWSVTKDFTSLAEIRLGVDSVQIPGGQAVTIQVDELVANNTGVDWTDFHLEVEPVDAPLDLLVQFNNVIAPLGFTTQTMDNALWVFGSVPDGDDMLLIYDMEVSSANGGFALFAVQEHPTVPEPSAVVLTMLGAVFCVGARSWRSRR